MANGTLHSYSGGLRPGLAPRSSPLPSPEGRQPLQMISSNPRKRKHIETIDLTCSDDENTVPSTIERLDFEDDLTNPDEADAEPSKKPSKKPSKINALDPKAIPSPLTPQRIAHSRYSIGSGGRQGLQAITSRVRDYALPTRPRASQQIPMPDERQPLKAISPNAPRKHKIAEFVNAVGSDEEVEIERLDSAHHQADHNYHLHFKTQRRRQRRESTISSH